MHAQHVLSPQRLACLTNKLAPVGNMTCTSDYAGFTASSGAGQQICNVGSLPLPSSFGPSGHNIMDGPVIDRLDKALEKAHA
jgi:hypothetical protein